MEGRSGSSCSAFLTLQDTVVHHPHFYIQMQMKINVPGFKRSSTKLFKSFLKAWAFLP